MGKRIKLIVILFLLYFSKTVYAASLNENVYMSIDERTGASLIEKDADKKIYPASTTKIMTCILALENLKLDDKVTVTNEMLNKLPSGSSTMKLVRNEVLTVEQLLYGLMLPSGNDSAIVLAYKISGSIEEFAKLMNNKAKELGCTNTNFTCPHGFHDDNHFTTARDMSKIFMYALKNDTFMKLIRTKYYLIEANGYVSYNRNYTNTNKLLENTNYLICGKTGYTEEAGNVFVSYSEKDDYRIINLLYDGKKGYYDGDYRFEDTKKVNEYIFSNYSKKTLLQEEGLSIKLRDKNANYDHFYSNEDVIKSTVPKNEYQKINYYITNKKDDAVSINLSILGNGYSLKGQELKLKETKMQSITNNYGTIQMIKIIVSILIDFILLLTIVISIFKILRLKKQKRRRINKKYY